MRGWKPLFEGPAAEEVLRVVEEIADELAGSPPESASLARGSAGQAVFFDYAARALESEEHAALAGERLDHAVAALSAEPMSFGLYSGFAGIAWAVEHLQEKGEDDGLDDLEEIDRVLLEALDPRPWPESYDLIDGLVGVGVYALERLPRPSAAACLESIVDHLAAMSESGGSGITWFTPPTLLGTWARSVSPLGHYNLGVAHGVPGILPLLAATRRAGIRREDSARLLEGGVQWLLGQRGHGGEISCFLDRTGSGVASRPARLAWCYGDAGIAAALLSTARLAARPDWERDALAIARRAVERPVERSGVQDAGLCHGACGLGHLFNRIYQATGDEAFADAARFWHRQGLNRRGLGAGVGGFADADDGFLTGAAGIGLALLAAVAPFEPEWDRVLLADIPRRL